jgi:hypothetical protein
MEERIRLVAAADACPHCPPGFEGNGAHLLDDVACTPCAAGTFKGLEGIDSCDDCDYGDFSGEGQSQCCSIGSMLNNATGECEACSPGEWWARGNCEPCAAGSYTNDTGYVPEIS